MRWRQIRSRWSERGQALAEFGLVLPILLLVMFGLIDFGWALQAWLSTENAARHAARYASVGAYDTAYCVDLDGAPVDPCAGTMRIAEIDEARVRSSIPDAAVRGGVGLLPDSAAGPTDPHYFHTMICSTRAAFTFTAPDTCSPTDDAGGPGDRVLVVVTYNHPFVTPLIRAFTPMVTFRSSQEMINERFRTSKQIGIAPGVGTVIPTATMTETPVPTDTPVPTNTPTPTPTPDCSQLDIYNFDIEFDDIDVRVRNNNPNTVYLVSATLDWTDQSGMRLDWMKFNGQEIWGIVPNQNAYDPPKTASPPAPIGLGVGSSAKFDSDFDGEPKGGLSGPASVTLTFDPGGCTVSASGSRVAATKTPKPTPTPCPGGTCPTPKPTKTPTKTPTGGGSTPTNTPQPTNTPSSPPTATPTPDDDDGFDD
ncbi:MAG: TadE/TadG family type IV pilus assembly protein [Anaerolineae bacterium]